MVSVAVEPAKTDSDLKSCSVRRLKKRADFLALRQGGRKSCDFFTVQARKRNHQDQAPDGTARIGFTVTKKTGNSVVRSRIKRRLRALTGICAPEGLFESDMDYVIIARRESLHADFASLQSALKETARHATKNARHTARPSKRAS